MDKTAGRKKMAGRAGGSARKDAGLLTIAGAGILLRFFYCLFSTIYERQYDIGEIDLAAGHTVSGGHLAYIQYVYESGHLPCMDFDPTSVYQFNHPPLHYAVSALWLRFASLFIGNTAVLEESIQIIPFISSVLTLVFLIRILGLLPMDRRGERLAAAVFAFHPALILLSGSVNNDGGGLLFTVLILYETMRWCRAQEWRTIVFLALWFGLGVMTKQNVAEMALPVGAAFLYICKAGWKTQKDCQSVGGFSSDRMPAFALVLSL